jgi:hypothetical protein
MIVGIALGIHYARERKWYMQELHKAHFMDERKLRNEKKTETERTAEWKLKSDIPNA